MLDTKYGIEFKVYEYPDTTGSNICNPFYVVGKDKLLKYLDKAFKDIKDYLLENLEGLKENAEKRKNSSNKESTSN